MGMLNYVVGAVRNRERLCVPVATYSVIMHVIVAYIAQFGLEIAQLLSRLISSEGSHFDGLCSVQLLSGGNP